MAGPTWRRPLSICTATVSSRLALEGVEPETLNTYEIVFENHWSPKPFSSAKFYFNDAQDPLVTDYVTPIHRLVRPSIAILPAWITSGWSLKCVLNLNARFTI